jgi:hypothetical protein
MPPVPDARSVLQAPEARPFFISAGVAIFACEGLYLCLEKLLDITKGKHWVCFAASILAALFVAIQYYPLAPSRIIGTAVHTLTNFVVAWTTSDLIVQSALEFLKKSIGKMLA